MKITDDILLEGCLKGDRQAQNQLYQKYKGLLFGVCLRYAKDRDEAQDILQDGFVKIFSNLYQYKTKGVLIGWMRRVVVNTALEHLRKRKWQWVDVPMEQFEDMTEIEEESFDKKYAPILIKLIQQLPDGYRTVFNLYVMEGYTHNEIAEILQITITTSRTQLFKAKKSLRKMLEQHLIGSSKTRA